MKVKIPKIHTSLDFINQYLKIDEERAEVRDEVVKQCIDEDKLIAECFDVLQATYTLIFMFVDDADFLAEYWLEHLGKLQRRFDNGEIEIEEYIDL